MRLEADASGCLEYITYVIGTYSIMFVLLQYDITTVFTGPLGPNATAHLGILGADDWPKSSYPFPAIVHGCAWSCISRSVA